MTIPTNPTKKEVLICMRKHINVSFGYVRYRRIKRFWDKNYPIMKEFICELGIPYEIVAVGAAIGIPKNPECFLQCIFYDTLQESIYDYRKRKRH